jgi:alpha-galactosidase
VGDWHPDPKKFPHGLAIVADEAHRRGMKFGLWTDWAQAGISRAPGALNVNDPSVKDWLVSDLPPRWKPEEFKGQTIDIGVPAAEKWATSETDRLVNDYHLDMFEHDGYLVAQGCVRGDHPHSPPDPEHVTIQQDSGFRFVYSTNSTDVSYRTTRAYYRVQQNLRDKHPELFLEVCNDGGRMVDFGSAAHGDYFSVTDTYDPLSNRRAFYDTSFVLPPAMLESYVEKWDTPRMENFVYMLRSGMMGWFSLMQDASRWTDEQRQRAKEELAFYKAELRPLIRDAQLYHVGPRPDGIHWDGIEYFDPERNRGAVYAFRGSVPDEVAHIFRLKGLRPNRQYALHFRDGSSPDRQTRGSDLMNAGVSIQLANPNSSEIVSIRELPD